MKIRSSRLGEFALTLGLAAGVVWPWAIAQDAPSLQIALYPGLRVTGEPGATYVIESKNGAEDDFWLTRGWIELTTPTAQWMDPVPAIWPERIYRAQKVTKPVVQAIANMVWIPPGTFTMGSTEGEQGRWGTEGPLTRVQLTKGFWIGKYEVTVREYLALMGNNECVDPARPGDVNRPAVCLSWGDAAAYCQKLTDQERAAERLPAAYVYRLPTEAEWEYACRAGTTTRFSFGDELACGDDWCSPCVVFDSYMWWCGNSWGLSQPVGRKLPNPWGLCDMHGNVWEWCLDRWSPALPGGTVVDPRGPVTGSDRVVRGGIFDFWSGWFAYARCCRSADRRGLDANGWIDNIGFRAVLAPGE